MDKDLKKAIDKYLRESHNEIMRNYEYSGEDIRKLMLDVDLSNYDLSNFTLDGKIIKGSPLWVSVESSKKEFQIGLQRIVRNSMYDSWKRGNSLFNGMLKTAYKGVTDEMLKPNFKSWTNLENRQLFKGRTLSGRIWILSNDYKREISDTLRLGYLNGESADKVAERLVKYVKQPKSKLVDIHNLKDKKASSEMLNNPNNTFYKAKRLAGNERNIAFREAENSRMGADYVLGFRINLSNAHPKTDICDYVNGDYPVWFKWNGWHPNCLCYRTFILPSPEEMNAYFKARRKGEEYEFKGKITDVPANFKSYMRTHFAQMNSWKSKPYFMIDNDLSKIIS